jgi:hypothetical protein
VTATGEREAVYNLRVADHHTYFVGSRQWGFSAWVHNANANGGCVYELRRAQNGDSSYCVHKLESALGDPGKQNHPNEVAHHIIPLSCSDEDFVQKAARGGFNINGEDNGVWMTKSAHPTGNTHPGYTDDVREIIRDFDDKFPNASDQEAAALLGILCDVLRKPLSRRTKVLDGAYEFLPK